MDKNLEYWVRLIGTMKDYSPHEDGWLDKYQSELEKSRGIPIIDLGCGWGNNAALLLERGFDVKGCDFCPDALRIMKEFYPQADTQYCDMRGGVLPYGSASAQIVIADLSLHYFLYDTTVQILQEIWRILKPEGVLLCRVNSVRATNYGVGEGEKLEENVYDTESGIKRFFDIAMINAFFNDWEVFVCEEYQTTRFIKPKWLWEIAARKI